MKIGDSVQIIEDGAVYPNYDTMAEMMKATRWEEGNGRYSQGQMNGMLGTVINQRPHPDYPKKIIYLVLVGDKEYLIGGRGIEKCEKCSSSPLEAVIHAVIAQLRRNRE